MPMTVVYALDPLPETIVESLFLAGPTPRSSDVPSWRKEALQILEGAGYQGVVFVPEARAENPWDEKNWTPQVEWERKCLDIADQIVFWVPRDMATMPALTTNVELGRYVPHDKLVFGAPTEAVHVKYLQKMVRDELGGLRNYTLESTLFEALDNLNYLKSRVSSGTTRAGGQRYVPLHVWTTPMFQSWHKAHEAVGNRLDEAKLLWVFRAPKAGNVFSYALWVKVWIESEQRFKENEFMLARTDISAVVLYGPVQDPVQDTEVVLVKEFRSPVRNSECIVHELAGGSSFKPDQNPAQVAADEVHEETGIVLSPERLRLLGARQIAGTLSSHQAHVFAAELTEQEMATAKQVAQRHTVFGNEEDSERTYLEVVTLKDLLSRDHADWSNVGMITQALLSSGQ